MDGRNLTSHKELGLNTPIISLPQVENFIYFLNCKYKQTQFCQTAAISRYCL